MDNYQQQILNARARYANQIDIRLGYEVDWIDGLVDSRVTKADVDYLIGSVHFLGKWGFDNGFFCRRA